MKAVKRTKNPSIKQIKLIIENLEEKFKVSSCIEISIWKHSTNNYTEDYKLIFVPGFDNVTCTIINHKNWPELLDKYFELMEE